MTLKSIGVSAVFLVVATGLASAQAANGRYQIGVCATHPLDGIVRLENNVLTFHESVCTLSNPVAIDGTEGYSYVGNCAGEGQEWQANMMVDPASGRPGPAHDQ